LIAAGLGYVDFALANPALFRLLFSSDLPQRDAPDLALAGGAAFGHLVAQVAAAGGQVTQDAKPVGAAMTADVAAVWAIAHGLADLMGMGPMMSVAAMPQATRDDLLTEVIARALPPSGHASGA
jgi:Tetracyclin repressor-like, C-terminal domain